MKKIVFVILLLHVFLASAQQTNVVDFKKATVDIVINPYQKKLNGTVVYTFDIVKKTDAIYLDVRKGVHPISVFLNGEEINYGVKKGKLWLLKKIEASKNNTLSILYEASPKKTMYFIGWDNDGKNQVWTQGQGKYTSNWLPSIDDVNDKMEFDVSVSFHKDYQVIANGKLIKKEKVNDTLVKWQYNMQAPMSSYLVALAIGKYDKKTITTASGKKCDLYYYPTQADRYEPTYRYSKKIIDFFETEIGVAYPWQNYKQVPVKDFLYAGMENTSCTLFSDAFLIDKIAFIDRNYVNVNAHELAHQWFGDCVTAASSTHHWLQEGFATYYALLAEKEVFGADYYYNKLYQSALRLETQKQTKLLNPKASSLVFYQKGAWTLHILRELIGDSAFKNSVQQYLKQYAYKMVNTANFMNVVHANTTVNLSQFESTWLQGEVFPMEQAKKALSKNKTVKKILKHPTKYCKNQPVFLQIETLKNIAKDSTITHQQKIKAYQKAFQGSLKVRQTLSEIIAEIPSVLKADFESLLQDDSYQTIENTLFKLWVQFPENRTKYLNQTKGMVGFNDKNIRTLWLTLALSTSNYEEDKVNERLQELIEYTGPKYHFEVRKNAFEYLKLMHFTNDEVLKNLEQATHHHNWRFKKFAVTLREELKKQEKITQ